MNPPLPEPEMTTALPATTPTPVVSSSPAFQGPGATVAAQSKPTSPSSPYSLTASGQANSAKIQQYISGGRQQGIPDSQLFSYLQQKGYVGATQEKPNPAIPDSNVVTDTENAAEGGVETVKNAYEDLMAGPQMDPQAVKEAARGGGPVAGAAEADAQVVKAGEGGVADLGKIVGGAAETLLSPILGPAQAVGQKIGESIGNSVPPEAAQKFTDFLSKHPEISSNASEVMDLANLAFPELLDKAGGVELPDTTTEEVSPEEAEKEPTTVAARTPAQEKQLQGVASDWEQGSKMPGSTYKNARAAIAKDPTIPTTLANSGINPFDHIQDGKYHTLDAANDLRDTTDSISHDLIRPSLQKLDASGQVTPTHPTDLADSAKLTAEHLPGLTADEVPKVQFLIDNKIDALATKYPEGMGLENMHDEKISYSNKSGYSQFKSDSDALNASANKALSLTLKDGVESGVPKDAPVHEANALLSKMYNAADYLEALDNKKAPESTASTIVKYAMKYGGAMAARHLFGGELGELITSFAGYRIGGALDQMLENMTNAGRGEMLDNLKQTQPQAFAKLKTFLDKIPEAKSEPKLLGPGSIQLPSEEHPSEVKVVPAVKTNLPTVEPKTGRMQTTYTSTPK